jgi:hypothetical protein
VQLMIEYAPVTVHPAAPNRARYCAARARMDR